jgi:fucose 4-O-acetylase-like acetyltransferase
MRSAYLDNLKFSLIVLVVFGHMLTPFIGLSLAARALYVAIYVFHMPAFVFLTGITTKTPLSRAGIPRLIVLLLGFQFLYELPVWWYTGHYIGSPWQPYWILWFLLSLILWRVMAPAFLRSEYPLATSIVLSLAVGCIPSVGVEFSLSRTFVFLPFFVAGHRYGWVLLEKLSHLKPLRCAGVIPIFALPVLLVSCSKIDLGGWLYGSASYRTLGISNPVGVVIRLLQLSSAAVLMVSFFALIPRQECWMTARGSRSMSIYLLHGFIVIALRKPLTAIYSHSHAAAWLILLVAAGTALWLLSIPAVNRTMQAALNLLIWNPVGQRSSNSGGRPPQSKSP